MAKDKEKKQQSGDDELDLASLSALVRPSEVPTNAEQDDDGGKLDLRALVASVPPAAPVEPEPVKAAPAAVAAKPASDAGKGAKKAAPAAGAKKDDKPAAAVVATPAAAPAASGGGGMGVGVGLGFGLAIAAVAWFVMNGSSSPAATVAGSEPPVSVALADRAPGHGDTLAEAPSTVEEADHESEPAAAPVAPTPTSDEIEDSADDEESADETAPESDDDEDVEADDAEEVAAAESETVHTGRRTRRSPRGAATPPATTATVAATTTTVASTPTPPPATTARRGGGLDSVLDQALGTSRTPPPPSTTTARTTTARTAPAGDLPDQPSQADVRRVLASVMPQIRGCAGEQVGLAVATLMVRSDGTVASAAVAGSPFGGTPQGSCMEGALRGAHFPAFRQTTFRVQYPMSIRPAT